MTAVLTPATELVKIDLRAEHKALYAPPRTPVMVEVPRFTVLMVDGEGDPNVAPSYAEAIEALYSAAYTLKFALKRGPEGIDFAVMPLETLWWADDFADFLSLNKAAWKWTAMLAVPDVITPERFERTVAELGRKKELPALPLLRLEPFAEGRAAQMLYVGPYSDEGPAIAELHAFIRAQGCGFDGRRQKHHEIYLSDPRRTEPAKLKTIIRQPVVAV
jgi:hypothetical protein